MIFPPEARVAAQRDYQATFSNPALPPVVPTPIQRADGATRIVEVRYTFLTEQGQRTAMLSLIRDVTDREEAAEALTIRTRELAFNAAIGVALIQHDTLPASLQACTAAMVAHLDAAFARIWTCSADGELLELQASAGRYTHRDGAHARVPVGQFKIGRIAATRQSHLTNTVQTDPEIQDPAWALREGLVAFAGYPLLVGDRLLGVMALFAAQPLPVTTLQTLATAAQSVALGIDRYRSATERADLTAQLQHALRLRDEFLLLATHELKTPLTSIKGLAQLLQRRARTEASLRIQQGLAAIGGQVDQLTALVQELLDVSRLENGQLPLHCAPFDLGALVVEVIAQVQILSETHPLRSAIVGEPIVVPADRERVRQVLVNLLENAIKYSPAGGAVEVRVWQTDERIYVAVQDHGIGIPAAQVAQIFVRYYRADNATGRQLSGLGLGLHISRELIARHGGALTVESVEEQGSTFTFWLPHPRPADEAAAV